MPAARRAFSSVASIWRACVMTSASCWTRDSSPSTPMTSCPSSVSVMAIADPNRPSPMTPNCFRFTLRLLALPDQELALGVPHALHLSAPCNCDGERQGPDSAHKHHPDDEYLPDT